VSGVLVIGAAGLIGRAVLAQAEGAGAAHAVVGRPSASMPEAHVLRLAPDAVDRLAGLLERLRPDAVVNCAGRTSGTDDELRAANVDPVAALLEALPAAAPGARLVHLGSAAEYAEVPDRATHESTPLRATTPYGAAKVAASRLVRNAADAGLDAVVARVFNPIGAGMPPDSLPGRAARLVRDARASGAAEVQLGPLDAVRDYVDVRDVATAVVGLATHRFLDHRVYNVGSGRPTLTRDLVGLIARRAGFTGRVVEIGTPSPRSSHRPYQVADISRIRATGWSASIPLAASVETLLAGVGGSGS
jgi:nucleoside-diphosphate-sugar epimerase